MGIDAQALRFLLTARNNGVSFANTMMIGRQNTFRFLPPRDAARIFSEFGEFVENAAALQTTDGYVEPMLTKLGAAHIDCLDYSSFEGASIIHDMNIPIPDNLKNRYSVVLDSGTLEHVFNYPQALKNAMEMVAVGGHFLAITPSNNFMGQGFYQFSPELFFRAFSEENGFKLEHMFICRFLRGRWYRVSDPKVIGQRVALINNYPMSLLVQAKRLGITEIFATAPQQSDYVASWTGKTTPRSEPPRTVISFVMRIVPEFVKRPIRERLSAPHYKITNKSAFQPIKHRANVIRSARARFQRFFSY